MAENAGKHIAIRGKSLKALVFYVGDQVFEIQEVESGDFRIIFENLFNTGVSRYNGAEGVVFMTLVSSDPSDRSTYNDSIKFLFKFGGQDNVSETFTTKEVIEVLDKLSTQQTV